MPIITKPEALPDKIQTALKNKQRLRGDFKFSFKTLYKPSATIPIVWFTLLSDGILFLHTHKAKGVFKEIIPQEINCIKLSKYSSDENMLEIVYSDIYADDFPVPIPANVDLTVIKRYLTDAGYSVL